MTRTHLAILFLTLFSFPSFAQKHELGKVTIEELNEKKCPLDSSAAAAVLFSIGKSYFSFSNINGFEIVTEKIAKIKIYRKEGYRQANQDIIYYIGGNHDERVSVSKAVTYNLVDGKIEKTKLTGSGEFTEKLNKLWSRKKIALPNVKEGSIIEFKFEVTSSYVDIMPWQFQTEIPVLYSEFTTTIPEYYIFNTRYKGYLSPTVQSEGNSRTVNYTSTDREERARHIIVTSFNAESFSFMENKTKYVMENVPALKDEAFTNNLDNYRSAIMFELSGIRIPGKPYENFATDWEAVVKSIYKNESFGDELRKTGYFEKDIDALLNGITTPAEKIGTLFQHVKSRMNWDNNSGLFCIDGVRKAYQDKKGNAAEINLMLTSMLRYAGFEANPVIISTRSNGIALFPSVQAYNYVITGVEIDNQIVLMDATSRYSIPNILPVRDLNWYGRIIRRDETSTEIDLMPRSNSREIVTIMGNIDPQGGTIAGKIREQYFDYNALQFRQNNNGVAKDSYIEYLEKEFKGLEVGAYEVQNSNDLGLPIVENYDFRSTNSVEIIGDKMYVSPLLFFTKTENPFKQETREYPVDFEYPNQEKLNVNLMIPEGYAVELLPEPKNLSMKDSLANFKYNAIKNGNQIQIACTFDINRAIIGPQHYEALKAFYKEIVDKQTEKIVLKKV